MIAQDAFVEFCALKAHFDRKTYDYYKYNGKVKSGDVENRKDKTFFFRLSRAYNKHQLHEYYIANMLAGETWVGTMNKDNWLEWKRKIVRLPEVFENDILAIVQLIKERNLNIKDIFRYESGEHPIIFKLLMGDFIQIETFIILGELIGFTNAYNKRMDDPIWDEWAKKILKYRVILLAEYSKDLTPYKKIVRENLLNTP